ncbi:MAG: hypothetical protein R3D62_07655 [Xanthobacteraceae bacterium]
MVSLRSASFLCIVVLALRTGTAVAAPDYIKARPDRLAEAYGQAVVDLAFSDTLTKVRAAKIKALMQVRGAQCPAAPRFVLNDVDPFQLDPADVSWIERFTVACDRPMQRTLLMVKKGEGVTAVPMAPGTTLADPLLQVDAGKLTRQTALARAKNCARAIVIDTASAAKPKRSGAPWTERWTVNACGRLMEMDVAFTPSSNGGTTIRIADAGGERASPTARDEARGTASAAARADKAERGPAPEDDADTHPLRVADCCVIPLPAGWTIYDRAADAQVPVEKAAAKTWRMPVSASFKGKDGKLVMSLSAVGKTFEKGLNQSYVADLGKAGLAKLDADYRKEIEGDITAIILGEKVVDYAPTKRVKAGDAELLATAYAIRHRSGNVTRIQRYRYLAEGESFDLKLSYEPGATDAMKAIANAIRVKP